jgi:hypothetical protein
VINADGRTTGRFSRSAQDWEWKADSIPIAAHISTDFQPPSLKTLSPKAGARGVSTSAKLRAVFSEQLAGLDAKHVTLVGPGGHRVKVHIKRHGSSIQIVPVGRLHHGARYTIRFGNGIEDGGGNALPPHSRNWTFHTAR